jgi:predicted metal-dependent enzyme (double-stranded beta helix superfamily)
MEKKVDELYGGSRPTQKSYLEALEDAIMGTEKKFTTNPRMTAFRAMIVNSGMDTRTYLAAARELYAELSERAAHKMSGHVIEMPQYNEPEKIKSILKRGGIVVKPSYLTVMTFVLDPTDLPPMHSGGRYPLLQRLLLRTNKTG